uniref:Uncharacterized protein n=1 Tax=Salix viminalis TaxID=40686 RepID=A0A6N2N145_SALVM
MKRGRGLIDFYNSQFAGRVSGIELGPARSGREGRDVRELTDSSRNSARCPSNLRNSQPIHEPEDRQHEG